MAFIRIEVYMMIVEVDIKIVGYIKNCLKTEVYIRIVSRQIEVYFKIVGDRCIVCSISVDSYGI
jgi:hypothetical protein